MKTHDSKYHSHSRWLTVGLLPAFLALSLRATAAETNSGSNIGLKLIAEGLGAPMALVAIPEGVGTS
jgi:hypothetical protein